MVILERTAVENARGYAVRVLLYNIVHLDLKPGSVVSENELSSLLSLSRTPVREALIELNRIGLVEILPQKGSYISKINYDIVEESRFVRLVMENAILKLVCEGIDQSYLDALNLNIQQQKIYFDSNQIDQFLELDNEFHRLLFQSVNKMWSYQIVKEQMVHFDRLRSLSTQSGLGEFTISDHEDILYAITRHDYEMAEMLMTRHLTRHLTEKEKLITKYPDYFTN